MKHTKSGKWFHRFALWVSHASGTATSFILALIFIIAWLITGPIFNFSDTWQLVINTSTTIVTFLMVFIIQHSQNRDTISLHLKIDELISSNELASNKLLNAEDLTSEELDVLKKIYNRRAQQKNEDEGEDVRS